MANAQWLIMAIRSGEAKSCLDDVSCLFTMVDDPEWFRVVVNNSLIIGLLQIWLSLTMIKSWLIMVRKESWRQMARVSSPCTMVYHLINHGFCYYCWLLSPFNQVTSSTIYHYWWSTTGFDHRIQLTSFVHMGANSQQWQTSIDEWWTANGP